MNLSKCQLWGPAFGDQEGLKGTALEGIPITDWCVGSGVEILGIPVCYPGDDTFAKYVWGKRVGKVKRILKVLEELPQAHVQYTLLRYCLSACRVTDLMRACPISHAEEECSALALEMRSSLDRIFGLTTSDEHGRKPRWH